MACGTDITVVGCEQIVYITDQVTLLMPSVMM